MAATGAVAQETPPSDPPKQEETPAERPTLWNEITLGYTSFRHGTSALRQYARPTQGLSLHELRLFGPQTETTPFYVLSYRGMPEQDNVLEGTVILNRGHTIVRGSREQYQYDVLDWRPRERSSEDNTQFTVDHSFAPGFGGFLSYRANERNDRYSAPRDAERTRTRTVAAGIGGSLLGGNANVAVVDRRITDDSRLQPNSLQRRVEASYARDFGSSISLEGSASLARIEQAGLRSSDVRSYAFAGFADLGPTTGLHFNFGRQDLDLNNVENAHVRKRLVSGVRLIQRLPGWNLQLGFKHKESERIRTDQSFVDVPKSNEYEGRLSGRFGQARVTVRGSWEDLRATAVMNTSDTRQLLWDDRATFQAKVDGGGELFSAYGSYTYRFQQNKQRGVEIGWQNLVVGGSYVLNSSLNGYAELAADNFNVTGGSETGQSLDFYFPNARSASVGINWAKDANLSASAGLNYYESGDVKGTQLTLSLKRQLSADHSLELVVAPWRQEDRLYNLTGYKTTFLMARYTVRF